MRDFFHIYYLLFVLFYFVYFSLCISSTYDTSKKTNGSAVIHCSNVGSAVPFLPFVFYIFYPLAKIISRGITLWERGKKESICTKEFIKR